VGRYRLVDCWSRAEWERRPAAARPEGAVPFGDCWLLLTEKWPDDSSGTKAEPRNDAVPTVCRPVVVLNALGLHLRPAGQFVGLARRFAAEIRVHRDGLCVDGKSLLDLAMLAAGCGTRLELEARGPDAEAAVAALADLVAARFHEVSEAERGDLAAEGLGYIKSAIGRSPLSRFPLGHGATALRPAIRRGRGVPPWPSDVLRADESHERIFLSTCREDFPRE
jgi:phosphocarrier protein HPr